MSQEVKQVIEVTGRKCCGCEHEVEEQLKKISGVTSVKADHRKKEAVVLSNDGISEEEAKSAIEKAGFKFESISK